MADILVSIALEKLARVLEKQQQQQRTLSAGTANELERLKDTVQAIRPFLPDAVSREIDSQILHDWLSAIGAVSYDIDDLLNKWPISGGLGEEGDDDERKVRYKVCDCLLPIFSCLDHAVSRYRIAISIQEIQGRLDNIYGKISQYGFVSSDHGGDERVLVSSPRLTTSFIEESEQMKQMIGREKDKETVISGLLGGSSGPEDGSRQVDVVAIIGGAGVGKSTLAREIFHDRRVRDHFNLFVWVHVSFTSDVIQLTKAILEKVKGTITFSSDLVSLQNELVEELRGKCFLLVFENFHSFNCPDFHSFNYPDEAGKEWRKLRLPLNSSAQGSRILVTTSMKYVAYAMNATFIHELEGLSDEYSWELFRSRAFVGRKVDEYSKLEDVGREIVNKCEGVPLATKAIAFVMHSKKTVDEWEKTLNSNAWHVESLPYIWGIEIPRHLWYVENLPALSLTYYNLPLHLKLCFTYCSMFPRGWVFEKDTWVNLWIAQGFVWSGGSRETEDVGAEHFDHLVAQSVFQQVGEDGETRYAMHDSFYLLATTCGQMHTLNQRHLFLHFNFHIFEVVYRHSLVGRGKKLRTLWVHGIDISGSLVLDLLHRANFLRALSLIGSKFSERMVTLLNDIPKMKHLRYLDLSDSKIVELPEELPHLRNLQTLNLTRCVKLKRLPEELRHLRNLRTLNLFDCVKLKRLPRRMGEMVSLRYLEIERTDSLEYLPQGLGGITSLRRLCKFIVGGGGSEGGEGCGIEELQQLNSLQGTLRIQHLERVPNSEEASKAQLGQKQYLRRLVISMSGRGDDAEESKRIKGILDSLTPHTNLEELKLFRYTGSNLPRWMLEMPHLWKVELVGCPRLEVLPIYENASPRELTVRDCHELKVWNPCSMPLEKLSVIDSSEFLTSWLLSRLVSLKTLVIGRYRYRTFPDGGWNGLNLLQTLEIWGCDELKSLPQGLNHLQLLENLIIFSCNNLEWLPDLPHLQRLSIAGCPLLLARCKRGGVDWPRISHIPNITINKQRIR